VPEIWSPELWRPDSKTGKIKKRRLENEDKSPEDESFTIITELEEPAYNLPSSTLLPVEEEESDYKEESQTIFS